VSARWSPLLGKLPRHGARDGPYVYDQVKAEASVTFFRKFLKIPNARGQLVPFDPQPWQAFYLRALYGWRHATTGRRRFKRGLIAVARGNGKSTMGAGIGIRGLVADGNATPYVIGTGTDKVNASIIFDAASTMALTDKRLSSRLLVRPASKRILRRARKHSPRPGRGKYHVLAADATHAHGHHPTTLFVDDLQAQPDEELITVLGSAQGTVDDPLAITFMTAGHNRATIGWDEWENGQRVLEDPALDEELLVAIYACTKDDDFDDEKTWLKANPSLGVTVMEDYLRGQVKLMKTRPSKRAGILRLDFNVWTEGEFVAWIDPEAWKASAGDTAPSWTELKGRPCYVGVSAASIIDVATVVYFFPPHAGKGHVVVMESFVPKKSIAKLEERDRISYRAWLDEGWLRETDGDVRDDKAILESVKRRAATPLSVTEIGVNPRGTANLMTLLAGAGFTVVQVLPSFTAMAPAMTEVERLVMEAELAHGGNRILSWMMGNAQAKANTDGDLKLDVENSAGNISGPMAMMMAVSRSLAKHDPPPGRWGIAASA
jgi:phage terminase large subunit-like protein